MNEYKGPWKMPMKQLFFIATMHLELKRMPPLDPKSVIQGFEKSNLEVITKKSNSKRDCTDMNYSNTNFLFMSSGNYDGMDILQNCK